MPITREYIENILADMMKPRSLCTCKIALLGEMDTDCSFHYQCLRCNGWVPEMWFHDGTMAEAVFAPGYDPMEKRK